MEKGCAGQGGGVCEIAGAFEGSKARGCSGVAPSMRNAVLPIPMKPGHHKGSAPGDDPGDEGHPELFKQYMDNPGFKRWVADTVFEIASEQAAAG